MTTGSVVVMFNRPSRSRSSSVARKLLPQYLAPQSTGHFVLSMVLKVLVQYQVALLAASWMLIFSSMIYGAVIASLAAWPVL